MHAEPDEEHPAPQAPPAPVPPTAGEWTIGIVFVLAALGVVALIALAIAGLPA